MNKKQKNIKKGIEFLPVKLSEELKRKLINNSCYDYRAKNNFIYCVSLIYHHQLMENNYLNDYVPLGSNYWKKVFQRHNYKSRIIQPLIEMKIVEEYNTMCQYANGEVLIRYRIRPELLETSDYEIVSYFQGGDIPIILSENSEIIENTYSISEFPRVSIDVNFALNYIENNAENICRTKIQAIDINDLVEDNYHVFSGGRHYYNMPLSKIKERLTSKKFQIFKYKNDYYMDDLKVFVRKRTALIKHHYCREVHKIYETPLIDSISGNNYRLHNNLVTFPSAILPFLKINNSTMHQFDLRTSQFLILANLINVYLRSGGNLLLNLFEKTKTREQLSILIEILERHKEILPNTAIDVCHENLSSYSSNDIHRFIRDVFFKDFYDVIQKNLQLSSRQEAKDLLFRIIFAPKMRNDKQTAKLRELYPTVIKIIKDFKEFDDKQKEIKELDEDKSNLALFLQRIEAEIYIDRILLPLKKQKIPCASRHDSIVVANGFELIVARYIKKVFGDLSFRYNQKVEDYLMDNYSYSQLDENLYLDWLIDENEINDNTPFVDDANEEEEVIEEYNEIIESLIEIGQRENYYGFVDTDFLEELTQIPELSQQQKNLLFDEIENLHHGHSFLSEETNNLLRYLAMSQFKQL